MSTAYATSLQVKMLWESVYPLLLRLDRYGEVSAADRIEIGNIKDILSKELFDGNLPPNIDRPSTVVDMKGRGRMSRTLVEATSMFGDNQEVKAPGPMDDGEDTLKLETEMERRRAACGEEPFRSPSVDFSEAMTGFSQMAGEAPTIEFTDAPEPKDGKMSTKLTLSMDDEMRDALNTMRSDQEYRIWLRIVRDYTERGVDMYRAAQAAHCAVQEWRRLPSGTLTKAAQAGK